MPEQDPLTYHYDSLLGHFSRALKTNATTQTLLLDMLKQPHAIRFVHIRRVYDTLTQGKADEIIYHHHKKRLPSIPHHQPEYALRMCWRLVEQLVNKISYYLQHQGSLGCLGSYVLRGIELLRDIKEQSLTKENFELYYTRMVDLLLEENEAISQQIYDLLINKGYICSVEEFYRMNRFEGEGKDYLCQVDSEENSEEEEEEAVVSDMVKEDNKESDEFKGPTQFLKSKLSKKSRKNLHSSRHLRAPGSGAIRTPHPADVEEEPQNETPPNQPEDVMMTDMNKQIAIKLNTAIDELLDCQELKESDASSERTTSKRSSEVNIKKMVKNIKTNYLKATEQLLTMEEKGSPSPSKGDLLRPSPQTVARPLQRRINKKTTITSTIAKRLQQQAQLDDLPSLSQMLNLDMLRHPKGRDQSHAQRSSLRNKERCPSEQECKTKLDRKISSLDFFNQAFVFEESNRSSAPGGNLVATNNHRSTSRHSTHPLLKEASNEYKEVPVRRKRRLVVARNKTQPDIGTKKAASRFQQILKLKRQRADDYLRSMRNAGKTLQRRHQVHPKGKKGLSSGMLAIAANQYAKDSGQTRQLEQLIKSSGDMQNMLNYSKVLQKKSSNKDKPAGYSDFDFSVLYQGRILSTSPVGKRIQIYDRLSRRIL